MSLAERLRVLRADKKVSLQVVADAVGISKPHVWELEKGKTQNPSLELLMKFAEYYSVSLDFLAGKSDVDLRSRKLNSMFRKIDHENASEEDLKVIEQAIDMALSLIKNHKQG
ncbi:helix-turn-helix domain-containing protein [Rheinheimera hassiensis]|jgi:transcriptional regulator with XRE-family HTH domain|uniref:helix-turn-helix domain-containing protein n=1 Tax=Rheinheimera hassiensis TaxID=1193627 RepID=UPI001F06BC57|nr:helix-turn-helix transcriptional regulator [Rheinheimera hassiensis]